MRTDVGRVRTENQDAWGIFPENGAAEEGERLFIVADGMGGHEHGREASRMAVQTIIDVFSERAEDDPPARLRAAYAAANTAIWTRSQQGAVAERMGTTCTLLALLDDQLYLAHVGDSRCYHIDERDIEQLTDDHTLVERMRQEGVLSADEARHHPRRHALMRALGIQDAVETDILGPFPVKTHRRYLLCSDGLDPVSESEIQRIAMSTNQPQEACDELVRLANERGGPDNITALIVSF
ncbi:MAG: Stp1/IreP family PP2C-type Ser/Thr phosphatase [Bacteroidetes bacterium]|nr:Stp1/IreP family PP2C-type Ser/Thr phosphatase [Bacteroidota bacterium]